MLDTWLGAILKDIQPLKSQLVHAGKQILDTHFDIYFSDDAYADICQQNIAENSLKQTAKRKIELFCLNASSLGFALPAWPTQIYERSSVQKMFAEAGFRGHYLHKPRTWQFYSESKKVGVQLISAPNQYAPWETGAPLRSYIHWGLTNHSRQICHAASLGHSGIGVLLGGAGGSGKSGTTLAGTLHGLSTVGDDYVLIEKNSARVMAYPLFNILKQDKQGVERSCPERAKHFGELNWQNKYEIHFSNFESTYTFANQLDIRAILIPRIANTKKSSLNQISPATAMRALAPSSAFQLPDGEKEGIGFLATLCKSLPCYEIALSSDPKEIAESIQLLLASYHD